MRMVRNHGKEITKIDKLDGKWTSWHENGQKSWEGNFKDGHLDGKYTSWYEDGQMEVRWHITKMANKLNGI